MYDYILYHFPFLFPLTESLISSEPCQIPILNCLLISSNLERVREDCWKWVLLISSHSMWKGLINDYVVVFAEDSALHFSCCVVLAKAQQPNHFQFLIPQNFKQPTNLSIFFLPFCSIFKRFILVLYSDPTDPKLPG